MEKTTTQTFKSDRAARIAFGKAERAFEAARSARVDARFNHLQNHGCGEALDRLMAPLEAAEDAAREKAAAIYAAAKAQGIYIHSYTFSDCNPTRDLILANMD